MMPPPGRALLDAGPGIAVARRFFPYMSTLQAVVHSAAIVLLCLGWAVGTATADPAGDVDGLAAEVQALLDEKKPAEAEAAARAALTYAEQTLGDEEAGTANISRLLGDTLFDQKRYAEAEPFFRRALAIRIKALGQNHADTARSAGDLAVTLRWLKRYDEAESYYRQALAIRQSVFGPDSLDVAQSWQRLSRLFDAKGDYAAAAEAMGNAVAVGTKALGENHHTVIVWMAEQAGQLHDGGRLSDAEPAYRRAIALAEPSFAADDADLANARQGLANLLRQTGRPAEAEPLYRAALPGREKAYGAASIEVASTLEGLGTTLEMLDRPADAVPLYARSTSIREAVAGPMDIGIATPLKALGRALMKLDLPDEARPVLERLRGIHEAAEGADGANVGDAIRWLAAVAARQDRNAEAELLLRGSLAISEKRRGPDDALTGYDLLMLGTHYSAQQRFSEAEPLLTRAVRVLDATGEGSAFAGSARMGLAMLKMATGDAPEAATLVEEALARRRASAEPDDVETASIMVSLALVRLELGDLAAAETLAGEAGDVLSRKAPVGQALVRTRSILGAVRLAQGRAAEAEPIYADVLARLSEKYGEADPAVQTALADLGSARYALGRYAEAAADFERSVAITDRLASVDVRAAFESRTGRVEDQAIARAAIYDYLIKSYDRLSGEQPVRRAELAEKAFLVAQRVIDSQAAAALAQMAARQAAGSGELADLARERQDLVDAWQGTDRRLTEARAQAGNPSALAGMEVRLTEIDRRLAEIDRRLATAFPDFSTLQRPRALSFAAARTGLKPDEVLLFFADTNRLGDVGFETYVWVVPKSGDVRWVRLAADTGTLSRAVSDLRARMGVGPQSRGAQSLAAKPAADRTGDVLTKAHDLYRMLLAPVADLVEGKDLVVVPSRKLGGLPFHMLVQELPPAGSADRYSDARWLARDHAITMLPSVASLATAGQGRAVDDRRDAYLGFANPLLTGRSGSDRRAFSRTACGQATEVATADAEDLPKLATFFRGMEADVEAVRALQPLPETADEACAIASALGVVAESVRLAAQANEAEVKALSESGDLSRARILHFATHGLVSGDLSGLAEPAIVLTPPETATALDDGLLTASEVTTLKLDADWVILSACNTAAGERGGEALSGLARAFFYAGARALLVSHWPVDSDAAVALVTGAVDAIAADPAIGRAEALRRAMLAEIAKGGRKADPAYWAPFVLVGADR